MREEQVRKDPHTDDDVTILDYAGVIWRYRWMIIGIFASAIVGTYLVTIISPKIYESTTVVMSPREGGGGGPLAGLAGSSLIQQLPGVFLPSLAPNRDMLLNLLDVRTREDNMLRLLRPQYC